MTNKTPITVAYGDGIGPEIMSACLKIMLAAGAQLEIEPIEIGEQVYLRGNTSGIEASAWESLRRTRVFFKSPITTPLGGKGLKSLNVTIRKALGLYANVRPCVSYSPAIETKHPMMNVVIVRENEEDLYAGIEHRQTNEVYQTLKLMTYPGSEKIIRYAFEYARINKRKKVTCFTKDNIMKMTDGMFHQIFDKVAAEYPSLETNHMIIDIGTARLADTPELFDVIVVPNLYGDIISDVAAQLTGSVGLAPSLNIGTDFAMFEAIHGSAPDIAGKGIANPSGLLRAGIGLLLHIGQTEVAEVIHNAWRRTIEEGIHTPDIYSPLRSTRKVGTEEFAEAVVERLGQKPEKLPVISYAHQAEAITLPPVVVPKQTKQLVGVDVFVHWDEAGRDPNVLGQLVSERCNGDGLSLVMITNRGQKVYPDGFGETFCADHWRCRFQRSDGTPIEHAQIIALLGRFQAAGMDFIKTENLYTFDGKPGYSLGQGQ